MLDSEVVVLSLKVKELEKKNKEILWVLERNQVWLQALIDDLQCRKRDNTCESGIYV